jgi:hypothetical protein
MYIPEPLEEASKIVKVLWESVQVEFPHWHGWAFRTGESGLELVLYVVPGTADRNLSLASIALRRLVPVKIVPLPPFQHACGSNGAEMKQALRPGASVHSIMCW